MQFRRRWYIHLVLKARSLTEVIYIRKLVKELGIPISLKETRTAACLLALGLDAHIRLWKEDCTHISHPGKMPHLEYGTHASWGSFYRWSHQPEYPHRAACLCG